MADNGKSRTQSDHQTTEITRREFVKGAAALTGATGAGLRVFADNTETEQSDLPILSLTINGQPHRIRIDPRTSLLDLLREDLAMFGTKKGCDRGQCGACTVLVNGRRIVSCLSLAITHEGDRVTTIEGLAENGKLHLVQKAFLEADGFQCGFCTPGQICSAVALLEEWRRGEGSVLGISCDPEQATLNREEIRERMSGNLCRCSAYPNIVAAVQAAHRDTERP